MEEENKEIADFIKNNPFPDDDKFLEIQVDMARFYARNFGGAHRLGDSDDYRIVKKMYENIEWASALVPPTPLFFGGVGTWTPYFLFFSVTGRPRLVRFSKVHQIHLPMVS